MNRRERNLFTNPDLFDDQGVDSVVDSAYLENLEKGRVIQSARQVGEAAIQTSLRNRGVRLPDWRDRVEQDVFVALPEKRTEARHELVNAFDQYGALYQSIGLMMPSPREFDEAGVSMVAQHNLWELHKASSARPEYVIAPHHGIVNYWSIIYSTLKEPEWDGLYIDASIADMITNGSDFPRNASNALVTCAEKNGLRWTLRVICGKSFEATSQNLNPHASISEYLAAQAKHIGCGEAPWDISTSTQLGRTSSRQVIEGYCSGDDQVRIALRARDADGNRVLSHRLVF